MDFELAYIQASVVKEYLGKVNWPFIINPRRVKMKKKNIYINKIKNKLKEKCKYFFLN